MKVTSWMVQRPSEPMVQTDREESPQAGEVLIQVAGCGVCHTDLGYYYDGVPIRSEYPLTLGHEVSGRVVEAGPGAEEWVGRDVVVPAVIPCGECDACRAGHGSICPTQVFPGNDLHGGFGTHLRVPARGLCPVPDLSDPKLNPAGLELSALSVIADAVSTPYQAILRSGLGAGDAAVFVGAGGVGSFGIQLAAGMDAGVVAIDVDEGRLARVAEHGAALTLNAAELGFKEIKGALKAFCRSRGVPTWRTKIFETSGTPAGQSTAYGLVGHGGYLSVVGFTPKKVELRLSNLMAFDAVAQGNWGCLPEHYPAIVDLALAGTLSLEPFIERRPMAAINETFEELHTKGSPKRIVLIP